MPHRSQLAVPFFEATKPSAHGAQLDASVAPSELSSVPRGHDVHVIVSLAVVEYAPRPQT